MKKTLIFDTTLSGHHLEYMHHLYVGAMDRHDEQFIFAVPGEEYARISSNFEWPEAKNVTMHFLTPQEISKVRDAKGIIANGWESSKLAAKVVKETDCTDILLIMLATFIPFLPWIIKKGVKISGIIYRIYLYNPKSGIRGWLDRLRYRQMARSKSVKTVFILNDEKGAKELNRIYDTDKFRRLTDPVPAINAENYHSLRNELSIPDDDTVFLHFGAMDDRKGTLEILDAIAGLPKEKLEHKTFIFAGKVNKGIREKFYQLKKDAEENGARIIVNDDFCAFDYLFNLCVTADCILAPYKLTDLSSGVMGYASMFSTPVIGPAKGLLGNLIRDNALGETIPEITPTQISEKIIGFVPCTISDEYAKKNTIDRFTSEFLCS